MTGSGKTLIYLLPILQRLSSDPHGIFAVVFAPSRELAAHICDQFSFYGAKMNIRVSLVTGGMNLVNQTVEVENIPHVIVATPGRFSELLEHNEVVQKYIKNVKFVVFDEFDKLLDDSLYFFISKILARLPESRQTILTTATFEDSVGNVESLQEKLKIDPVSMKVFNLNKQLKVVETLSHFYLFIPHIRRDYFFIHTLLQEYEAAVGNEFERSIIVFFNRCRDCHFWHKILKQYNIKTAQIHSFMPQAKRVRNMNNFLRGGCNILLATDLGSRGLDIRAVELVINYDFPSDYKDYVHRAGRAARGGARGRCLSIITQYDVDNLKVAEDKIGSTMELYGEFKDDDIMKHANKLDKLKRKLKIGLLIKGTDEKFNQFKERKMAFQKSIKSKEPLQQKSL
jgi:ATP-dependent RNA helicase DDX49/DBP8